MIAIRRRLLSKVHNSNVREQAIIILARYWSSHRAITRKKYERIPICESIIACIKYFSQDRCVRDSAYIKIEVAHKYQKYRFWFGMTTVKNKLYCKNPAMIHTTEIINQTIARNLLYLIYRLLWSIKIVKQSAIFFLRNSLMNVSWSILVYIWSTTSLLTIVFLPSGIYDLL